MSDNMRGNVMQLMLVQQCFCTSHALPMLQIIHYAHIFTAGIPAVGYGENPMQGPESKPKYFEDAHDVSKVNTSGWSHDLTQL